MVLPNTYIITLFFFCEDFKIFLCRNVASCQIYSVRYGVPNIMYRLFSYKRYITQDKLFQTIKEMKVRKSWLPFLKQSANNTLNYTIRYMCFQSLYYIISVIYAQTYTQLVKLLHDYFSYTNI